MGDESAHVLKYTAETSVVLEGSLEFLALLFTVFQEVILCLHLQGGTCLRASTRHVVRCYLLCSFFNLTLSFTTGMFSAS